jgi:hypothetical protein
VEDNEEACEQEEIVKVATTIRSQDNEDILEPAILPVDMPEMIQARKEFSKEYWRNLVLSKVAVNASILTALGEGAASNSHISTSVAPTVVTDESAQGVPVQATVTEAVYRYYAQ